MTAGQVKMEDRARMGHQVHPEKMGKRATQGRRARTVRQDRQVGTVLREQEVGQVPTGGLGTAALLDRLLRWREH